MLSIIAHTLYICHDFNTQPHHNFLFYICHFINPHFPIDSFQRHVLGTYQSMEDYKFVKPKTRASFRTIYIDTDTINELQAWRKVQQKVLKVCDLVLSYNSIPTSKHTLPF